MSSALGTLFTSRCPSCQEGPLFKGLLQMHERCPSCGAVYYRDPGSFTGATVLTYVMGSAFAVVLLATFWATGRLADPGSERIVVGLVVLFVLAMLRPMKALWVGMLYDWGQVYADDDTAPEDDS